MMRENPFQKLYEQINNTPDYIKYNNLPEWPVMVDIELTNYCNMKCLFCFNPAQSRQKGHMSEEVLLRILNEITPGKIPIRFIRWGENLIHKNVLKWLGMCKKRGFLTHLTTNGSLLTKQMSEEIVDIELDSIKFSFQGADEETYAAMRNNDLYKKVVGNLKTLFEVRGNKEKPHIQVSSTMTNESEEMIEDFKKYIGQYADFVAIGRTNMSRVDYSLMNLNEQELKWLLEHKKNESLQKVYKECIEVYDKLSFNWDGTVSACCGDYDNILLVGDIKIQSLKEIWKGEQIEEIRKILLRHDHNKLNLCRHCYFPLDVGITVKDTHK